MHWTRYGHLASGSTSGEILSASSDRLCFHSGLDLGLTGGERRGFLGYVWLGAVAVSGYRLIYRVILF